jgi:CBS domain-containing protein
MLAAADARQGDPMRAQDVMTSPPITVTPETPVLEIAALLVDRGISAVPVVDASGRAIGIVSEGDLLRRCEIGTERQRSQWLELLLDRSMQAADFSKAYGLFARDVMTREVISVSPDTDLGEIARILEQRRIKRVPVVQDGVPVGIVSRANLLRGLVATARDATASGGGDDLDLRTAIENRLRDEPWIDLSRLNIVVSEGVVHLWGIVRSEEQRRALKIAAESISGVRAVEDHLSPDWFANSSG